MTTRFRRRAIVVGGGIGGLAAAVALSQRGWEIKVFERRLDEREIGAGLSLWPNALRALDALGLGAEVQAQGLLETEAGIRTSSGRWLLRTDMDQLRRRFGPLVIIHRRRLLELMLGALPSSVVSTGIDATQVQIDGTQAVVTSRDGGTHEADLVVGADGIHSTVRRSLWPTAAAPRYAGYTAWRLIADAPAGPWAGGESWGRGKRFGIAPLPNGRVYAYATANTSVGQHSEDGELLELRRRFGSWHAPIPALLQAAEAASVTRHDIHYLPDLKTFTAPPVVVLGDAAHAMTPDLGQGACQALEDAVTLASLLESEADLSRALAAYDHQRRPRTQQMVERSRRLGRAAQARKLPAAALRNTLMAISPASAQLRSLAPTLSWTPPA